MALKAEYGDLLEEHEADQAALEKTKAEKAKQEQKRKTWRQTFSWRTAPPSPPVSSDQLSDIADTKDATNKNSKASAKTSRPKHGATPHIRQSSSLSTATAHDARSSLPEPHVIRNPAMVALMRRHDIKMANRTPPLSASTAAK